MKLIKYLENETVLQGMGHCNPVDQEVWVECSCGLLETLRITFHEFYHLIVGSLMYSIPNPNSEERRVLKFLSAVNDSIHLTPF
jgi:hypothetical protein